MSSNNINRLLEDISIRHACKNVNEYIAELEKSLDIKLKLGCQKYEYVYAREFEWFSDAYDKKKFILANIKNNKMFNIASTNLDGRTLTAKFMFHPENAV